MRHPGMLVIVTASIGTHLSPIALVERLTVNMYRTCDVVGDPYYLDKGDIAIVVGCVERKNTVDEKRLAHMYVVTPGGIGWDYDDRVWTTLDNAV